MTASSTLYKITTRFIALIAVVVVVVVTIHSLARAGTNDQQIKNSDPTTETATSLSSTDLPVVTLDSFNGNYSFTQEQDYLAKKNHLRSFIGNQPYVDEHNTSSSSVASRALTIFAIPCQKSNNTGAGSCLALSFLPGGAWMFKYDQYGCLDFCAPGFSAWYEQLIFGYKCGKCPF